MTFHRLVGLALVAMASGAPHASAQRSANAAPAGCTYQSCALRVEPVFFGVALMKGSAGEQHSRLGAFGGGVEELLAGPDSASAFARSYVSATKRASILGLLGGLAYGVVILRTDSFRSDADATDAVLALGGVGLVVASVPFTLKARRSLARSVWWYNAALPK